MQTSAKVNVNNSHEDSLMALIFFSLQAHSWGSRGMGI